MWHSIGCKCKVQLKYDTENPEIQTPITKEEYLEFMNSLKGQPNVHPQKSIKEIADAMYLCEDHAHLGYTQNLLQKIKEVCKLESEKITAANDAIKKAELETKRKEVEELVRNILAEKNG